MYVLGVVGAETVSPTPLLEHITDRLAQDGSVAVVSPSPPPETETGAPSPGEQLPGVTTTVGLSEAGEQLTSSRSSTIENVLERLAVDHDYALIENGVAAGLPRVVYSPDGQAPDGHVPAGNAPDGHADDSPGSDDTLLTIVEEITDDVIESIVDQLTTGEQLRTLESIVADIKQSDGSERAGAIATFTGRVRAKDDPDDARTEYLEFEKYDGVAEERLANLTEELEARDGVIAVELHHRTGVVESGEDIVFVVVLAGHRREAFRTVEDGIDRLKAEVPLFKKEVTVEDEFWSHDRP